MRIPADTPDHTPSPNIATFMATLTPLMPAAPVRPASPIQRSHHAMARSRAPEPNSPAPPTVHDGAEHKIAMFRESLETLTEKELNKIFVRVRVPLARSCDFLLLPSC
jgi:hypothetical protein